MLILLIILLFTATGKIAVIAVHPPIMLVSMFRDVEAD
ncbi:hypothetical protein J2755_001945 [Methanohalophilus levihalophilus]|nr:hypothetical protein [Methanohalophilus levihalophilus]